MGGRAIAAALVAVGASAALVGTSPAQQARTIRVGSESEFAAAVSALRESGGTIVLLPRVFAGRLVVAPRSRRLLRIVGTPGARIGRILFDHTQRVSLERVTVAPLEGDAWIGLKASDGVLLDQVVVSARGTPFSASVLLPDSSHVEIRRSRFAHCGDRSPTWAHCLLLGPGSRHVTVQDSWFHDCYGCDFVHGRFGFDLELRRNRFERALPCSIGRRRCGHQDLVELFAGRGLVVEDNRFGVYRVGGAQLYLTNAIDHVRIVNNVFLGTDPRVPGYQSRVGLIVGSRATVRVPHFVHIVNNTILTGARRVDGYLGSIRMSTQYAALPLRMRPVLANNVIGRLENPHHLCDEVQASVANVVLDGTACSASDQVGSANLDVRGRPTSESAMVIDAGSRRYAPKVDIRGRSRSSAPDIGAFEYLR